MKPALIAAAVWAASALSSGAQTLPDAKIYVLGEVHDNTAHHDVQADLTAQIAPVALVFEMLTPAQAEAGQDVARGDETALATALAWADSGWPEFALYAPIFAAAPEAILFGAALERPILMDAMSQGASATFGVEADKYGLAPLSPEDQAAREEEQAVAHCNALPADMLPGMVEVQRLRDAAFARTAIEAFEATGGPVVVITGTGHARADYGVPAYIRAARPDITVFTLGQVEGDEAYPDTLFDMVIRTDPTPREDPCAVFQ